MAFNSILSSLFMLFLLSSSSINPPIEKYSPLTFTSDLPDFSFNTENITLCDDAFHGSEVLHFTEWWYFDAELTQGYTLQFSIHVYNIFTEGFVAVNLNIYHYGIPVVQERDIYPIDIVELSKSSPSVHIEDKLNMKGTGNDPSSLSYTLFYNTRNASIFLEYIGLTEGWKGVTPAGNWAVILPKASVSGYLIINNSRYQVTGIGYHDHNWNVTIVTGMNFGWIWGKTNSQSYTITWSDILPTWYQDDPILVVNKEKDGYIDIPSSNIHIIARGFSFKNGYIIPWRFHILAEYKDIFIDIFIDTSTVDYRTVFGLINYWRYHVHCTGSIKIAGVTEKIDEYNIAEFIRFRFY
ncbi:MAG TPA: hypothetical protein ENI44_00035 [Thermoplasmatales archaeon]|nr:hypothetical protein [Thermoplasmatales archaeon]